MVARVAEGAEVVGILLMVVAAASLGRGLTAVPLPNARAVLRTGGLYRFVRHPIYTGLLLVVLINAKARWEERHLAERFPGYRAYCARTLRFVPGFGRKAKA